MISWLLLVLRTLSGVVRYRVPLSADNAVLRHQLAVLQRERPRPLLRPTDRVLWIALELKAKLGVEHAPGTIGRYMVPREADGRPVSSTWRTFLPGHANELWTMDLTTQPLWDYSVRYVLVLMELRSRQVVHVAVTASPTLAWLKQRIREATPLGSGPRFVVHDNDGIFGQFGRRRPGKSGKSYRSALDLWLGEVLGIEGIPGFGPGSPRAPSSTRGNSPIKITACPVLGGVHHVYRLAA